MAFDIKNLLSRPIFLTLNSGASIRLSPGATAKYVSDVEVKDNSKIGKLKGQRAIAVEPVEATRASKKSDDAPPAEPVTRSRKKDESSS
jgi:hypothetical protein